MSYKSGQFCHAQANWIIRQTKGGGKLFFKFSYFLTHPKVLAVGNKKPLNPMMLAGLPGGRRDLMGSPPA